MVKEKQKLEKIKKKKVVKKEIKTIKTNSGLLIIGILAIISIFIIITVSNSGINIQGEPVYPSGRYPYKTSNVPYEKVKNYQFCHEYECELNCRPFPDRKCEYYAKGTTANCPVFMYPETQISWQPHWKCE